MLFTRGPPSGDGPFRVGYGLLVPAIGFVLLAIFVWLYEANRPLYTQLLTWWMNEPFRSPFLDLAGIPASIACWQQGIDVYLSTPCDVLGRAFNYSPLWLRLTFVPTGENWTPWLGLGLVTLFLLSLGCLPQPQARSDRALVVLGTFSCLPVFAVERGNADLIMFLLVLIAALWLPGRPVARVAGYAVILLAGALKFYPLAALLLLGRERLRIAILLGCAALAAIAAFVWWFRDELLTVLQGIPSGGQFLDNFGAMDLPRGIRTVLMAILPAMQVGELASARLSHVAGQVAAPILTAAAIAGAIALALRRDIHAAIAAVSERVRIFLLMGAALVCGCFFAGQSIGYRGVFLLFVLPCLLGLARLSRGFAAWIFRMAAYGTLCALWALLIQREVAYFFGGTFFPVRGSAVGYTVWILRELIWWWLVTVLLAVLIRGVLDSPASRDFVRCVRGARGAWSS